MIDGAVVHAILAAEKPRGVAQEESGVALLAAEPRNPAEEDEKGEEAQASLAAEPSAVAQAEGGVVAHALLAAEPKKPMEEDEEGEVAQASLAAEPSRIAAEESNRKPIRVLRDEEASTVVVVVVAGESPGTASPAARPERERRAGRRAMKPAS